MIELLQTCVRFSSLLVEDQSAGWFGFPFIPREASSFAWQVDAILLALTLFSGMLSLGIAFFIIYFAVKYRKGTPADRTPSAFQRSEKGKYEIEITWTVIPLLIAMGLFVWAAGVFFRVKVPPQNAEDIYVVAKQWMWKFQHSGGQREIDALHVPVGQTFRLIMTSQDVIHSFFVPAFRVKQDVVPGRYVTAWFKATQPGTYHLFCSQYCGTNHALMTGNVIVMEPDEYQRWLRGGMTESSAAARGEVLFQRMGCSGCHNSPVHATAPRLEGLWQNPVKLADGRSVIADRQYIHDSILLPQKDIVAGYSQLMPVYTGVLNEEQVLDLVEYIRSLSHQPPRIEERP